MKTLRPHQTRAVESLRASIRKGSRRPLLQLPVGAGKTVIAASIIRMARERGNRVLFIVDALSLIDQTVQAFYEEGVGGIGVIQADHIMTDYSKPVQIASLQTIMRRGMPETDLVIVDECHAQFKWLIEIMASPEWAGVPFIGLTATPWSKGLGNIYDDLIEPATMQELIDAGYLAPFRIYAPSHPDLSGVKVQAGDYRESELSDVMVELVADVVRTWKQLGEGRPTICFGVDRAHAKKLQQRFEAAGVGCGYIDAYTPVEERAAIHAQLDAGEISVVSNVGCLVKGVDWAIGCIILACPTKSEIKFVQSIGRGLRVNPEVADDCIILDHTDNTLRLGFPTEIHRAELCTAKKGERQKREPAERLPKECPKCTYIKPTGVRECPACGFVPDRQSEIEEIDGELKRLKPKKTKRDKQLWYSSLIHIQRQRGYSPGWVANTYREVFGVWPRGLSDIATDPPQEVRNYVTAKTIRYVKGRESAAA